MPVITSDELRNILELFKDARPLTLNISAYEKAQVKLEFDEYISGKIKDIKTLLPLSIYYILTKMSSSEQISFIKDNINYLKDNDDSIFLYGIEEPKELSYYLSFDVLKNIYEIDKVLFEKIINGNVENVFNGFTHNEYLLYFEKFKSYLSNIKTYKLFAIFDEHSRICFKQSGVNNPSKLQEIYDKEFIDYFKNNYKDKIDSFTPQELLNFIFYFKKIDEYKEQILIYKEKLKLALQNIEYYDLNEYLCNYTNKEQQQILFSYFLETIVKKQDIRKIISNISSDVIFNLYKKDKSIFANMTLFDWVKLCAKKHKLSDEFKSILDDYKIDNIIEIFNEEFFSVYNDESNLYALKYIENKYRSSLKSNKLIPINKITSIFTEEYLNNLKYLEINLKNKIISKNSPEYKENLAKFIFYLNEKNIALELSHNDFSEISKLFYCTVMGSNISILFRISNIEEITILNRLGNIEFKASDFTVSQLKSYNVKQHKKLCILFGDNKFYKSQYQNLILKLMLLVGYNNAKKMLEICSDIPVLEHLVGSVYVKDINLDEQGNPILNKKIMNLLFSDKNYLKIYQMLKSKDNDLYKYFPRIFNEWKVIKVNSKDKSLKSIIDFLKTDDITLPPKYYRLEGLFKYIGCRSNVVDETLYLHDQMLKRIESTIPRVYGTLNDYSYEILKLSDMQGLTVGNKTDCCFTILGNGYSCLKHAVTSKNGRILVIKKDSELIAHSWIWRNGDLLCLDNIEISKSISEINFLDVYLKFADEIIEKSFETEGVNNCIKNITIGYTSFDKRINGIENYPCLISKNCNLKEQDFNSRIGNNRIFMDTLPKPIEEVTYSDSKNVQYLLRGTGVFNLRQSSYIYMDERNEVLYYSNLESYSDDYLRSLNNKLNSLRYMKYEEKGRISSFKIIDVEKLEEVYCNDDWYLITYKDGNIEKYINSKDIRINNELPKNKSKIYVKNENSDFMLNK